MNKKNQEWLEKEIETTKFNIQKLQQHFTVAQQNIAKVQTMIIAEQGKLVALQSVKDKICPDTKSKPAEINKDSS